LVRDTDELASLPYRPVAADSAADVQLRTLLEASVLRMQRLNRSLASAETDRERTAIRRRLDAADADIDRLVYELYASTAAEIAVVEAAKLTQQRSRRTNVKSCFLTVGESP
jgi:hypothetical protein